MAGKKSGKRAKPASSGGRPKPSKATGRASGQYGGRGRGGSSAARATGGASGQDGAAPLQLPAACVRLRLVDEVIGDPRDPEVARATYIVLDGEVVARQLDAFSPGPGSNPEPMETSPAAPARRRRPPPSPSDEDSPPSPASDDSSDVYQPSTSASEDFNPPSSPADVDQPSTSASDDVTRPSSATSVSANQPTTSRRPAVAQASSSTSLPPRRYGQIQRVPGLDVDAILGSVKQSSKRTFRTGDLFAVPLEGAPTAGDWDAVMSQWAFEASRHERQLTRVQQLQHQVRLLRVRLRQELVPG